MATSDPSVISMIGPRTAWMKALASFIGSLRSGRVCAGCAMVAGVGRSGQPLIEHICTETNQSHGPVAKQFANAQDVQIVKQEKHSDCDQDRGRHREAGRMPGAWH